MDDTTNVIEASQAFLDQWDPRKALKRSLVDMFENDELAIYLMYSEPPTKEECLMGLQLVDVATLPLGSRQVWWDRSYRYNSDRNFIKVGSVAFAGRVDLDTSQLTLVEHDSDRFALRVVPKAPNVEAPLAFSTSRYDRASRRDGERLTTAPYKWAILAHKNALNQLTNTWHLPTNTSIRNSGELHLAQVLVDFRGGIPLTVGGFGTPANIWITSQYDDSQYTVDTSEVFPAQITLSSLSVPLPA